MDFSSLFDVISQFGWSSIIIVFLICLILVSSVVAIRIVINNGLKSISNTLSESITTNMSQLNSDLTTNITQMNSELTNTLSTQNDKLINYIIDSKNSDSEKHSDMLNHRMKMSTEINNKIRDIMNANSADRVAILEFHNSYQNISGVPFAKFSCTYEWFKPGVLPLSNECKAMSFSSISPIVDNIINSQNSQIVYDDINVLENESPTLFSLLDRMHSKSLIFNAMYDEKNTMIGLLCLEYHNKIPKHINLESIKIDAAQITSILNLRYQFENETI